MAPRVDALEREYGAARDAGAGAVNFVTIDGGDAAMAPFVELFGVDGIPHLAFISARGEVLTALIGLVPRDALRANVDALVADRPLPYLGYDAFRARPSRVLRVRAPAAASPPPPAESETPPA